MCTGIQGALLWVMSSTIYCLVYQYDMISFIVQSWINDKQYNESSVKLQIHTHAD